MLLLFLSMIWKCIMTYSCEKVSLNVRVYVSTCMWCVYVHICGCKHGHMCGVCACVCVRACVRACVCICMHSCVYMCMCIG